MAVDTRDKRASALSLIAPTNRLSPDPDGLTMDQGDRKQEAFAYRGIAPAGDPVFPGSIAMAVP